MEKIEKLTIEQEAQIQVYQDRYFAQATSTEPADRPRAETAARRLAEIAGVKTEEIIWARDPEKGKSTYQETLRSFGISLEDSFSISLKNSIRNSISDSLWNSTKDSIRNSFSNSLWNSIKDSIRNSFGDELWNSIRNSIGYPLNNSLWASTRESLGDSLWTSLRPSLKDLLGHLLWNANWNSIGDTGWLCYHTYAVEVLKVECNNEYQELLHISNEITASCFAVWIAPGKIILCERPATTEIANGKLIELTWK
jgi:hypothetical protein